MLAIEGAYCTEDDVFKALAAQAFVVRPRPVQPADVDGASGTIRLEAHGLTADDVVTFKGTSGGSLPTGVTAFAPYYPTVVSFDLFKVAATLGGSALTFVAVGSGWGIVVDPRRRIRWHAVDTAAEINQNLTAHDPPIQVDPTTGKYPPILIGLNARMAARAAVTSLQVDNAAYRVAIDRLFAREEMDRTILDELRKGWPLNPRPTDQTEVADNSARAASSRAALDWTTGEL